MWQESVAPPLVIDYVSGDGSEERDATPSRGKFWVYEKAVKAPYHLIWYPNEERIEAFELRGTKYRPMKADAAGRFHIPMLNATFGIWDGEFLGYPGPWLRAWDSRGKLLPSEEEAEAVQWQRAEAEKQRAEAEKKRAESQQQRADALAKKLRELGIDPDRI